MPFTALMPPPSVFPLPVDLANIDAFVFVLSISIDTTQVCGIGEVARAVIEADVSVPRPRGGNGFAAVDDDIQIAVPVHVNDLGIVGLEISLQGTKAIGVGKRQRPRPSVCGHRHRRGVVDACDRHADGFRGGVYSIAGDNAKAVGACKVCVWCVGEGAVGVDHHRSVGGCCLRYRLWHCRRRRSL